MLTKATILGFPRSLYYYVGTLAGYLILKYFDEEQDRRGLNIEEPPVVVPLD